MSERICLSFVESCSGFREERGLWRALTCCYLSGVLERGFTECPASARWETHRLMYHKGVRGEKEAMKSRISLEISFVEGLKVTVW